MQTIQYYREPNGDYLAVQLPAWKKENGQGLYEGRSACIGGVASSVCTGSVGGRFLRTCRKVSKRQVPKEWRKAIGLVEA